MKFEWYVIVKYYSFFLQGFLVSLEYVLISVVTSFCFGLAVSIIRTFKFPIISKLFDWYVVFFRETPLLIHLYIIFYGLPQIGIFFSAPISAILAITLNEGAFISEIIRGGIQAIPKGQEEASKTLALNDLQTMRYITFPQALWNVIPSLVGHSSYILKDTALLSLITIKELMFAADYVNAAICSPLTVYFLVAVIYYLFFLNFNIIGMCLENSSKWREKKLGKEWR